MADSTRVLLLGIGNPGRRDDGIGPALAEAVERLQLPHLTVDAGYQLQPEDAAALAESDLVLFADADSAGPEPFSLRRVAPQRALQLSTHALEPAQLLALAQEAFGRVPEAWLLAVRGYRFEPLAEGLTERGAANLAQAIARVVPALRAPDPSEAIAALARAPAVPRSLG